jgi:hypothetical protein
MRSNCDHDLVKLLQRPDRAFGPRQHSWYGHHRSLDCVTRQSLENDYSRNTTSHSPALSIDGPLADRGSPQKSRESRPRGSPLGPSKVAPSGSLR